MPPKNSASTDTAATGADSSNAQGTAAELVRNADLIAERHAAAAADHATAADKAADAAANALATTLEAAERVSAMHADITNLLERALRVADQVKAAVTPLAVTVEAVPGAAQAAVRPLSELLQLVKRRTVLAVAGAPDRVIETSIGEHEVLSHADRGHRVVVVTKDGQKHVWPAPQA